jgi:inner membrane protein
MLARTHAAFGFLSALVMQSFLTVKEPIVFFILVMLGALLPDIDQPNSKLSNKVKPIAKVISKVSKHRGIFHSLFFALLLPGLVYYFVGSSYGIALFIGYLSHLIIDGFTKEGINFLQPFGKLHLSGFIGTGTFGELVFLVVIIAAIVGILI